MRLFNILVRYLQGMVSKYIYVGVFNCEIGF